LQTVQRMLGTIGPPRPREASLLRAQVRAAENGAGLNIARGLIESKLAGQERIARSKLRLAAEPPRLLTSGRVASLPSRFRRRSAAPNYSLAANMPRAPRRRATSGGGNGLAGLLGWPKRSAIQAGASAKRLSRVYGWPMSLPSKRIKSRETSGRTARMVMDVMPHGAGRVFRPKKV